METNSQRNERSILKAVKWYASHCQVNKTIKYFNIRSKEMKIKVLFITNSFKAYNEAIKNNIDSLTISDFVQYVSPSKSL